MATDLLDRVRKLLAQAEDEGTTAAEAEAFTARASELMARYGIDRALLGATRPETDKPGDKTFPLDNPWAAIKGHMIARLGGALRCQVVLVKKDDDGSRSARVFGYQSDIERTEVLYTSLQVQMVRALAVQPAPAGGYTGIKAWRRSWMLGYITAVVARVRAAEESAEQSATSAGETAGSGGKSTALVLADRSLTVRRRVQAAYPHLRRTKVTYTGNGYAAGHREGQKADIGGAKLRSRPAGAIGR